jgi:hypothetical protein
LFGAVMTTKPALVGVIEAGAAAAAADTGATGAGGQLELLEPLPPTRFVPGTAAHDELVERVKRDRAGRPPGARNVKTEQMMAFIVRVFGDPALERARMATHTPQTLASELHCSYLEAATFLDRLRADLMRYLYSPKAATDANGQAVIPSFTMVINGDQVDADLPPWLRPENQPIGGFLTGSDAVSHKDLSHDEGK